MVLIYINHALFYISVSKNIFFVGLLARLMPDLIYEFIIVLQQSNDDIIMPPQS